MHHSVVGLRVGKIEVWHLGMVHAILVVVQVVEKGEVLLSLRDLAESS